MIRFVFLVGVFLSSVAYAAPLRIGVSDSLMSLPVYVAESEGFFAKRGVGVEIVNCLGGMRCFQNMLDGKTELSTATELPMVFNSFTRSDFVLLTTFASASNHVKVLARSSERIDAPHKLSNKTLGYVKGSSSQYVLDLVLVYNGIDPGNVKLKELKPENALTALANKEVDAVSLWEPFVSRIQQELGSDVQLVPIPKLYTESFNLFAMQSVVKNRPQELERLILALKDSTQFIQTHPDKAKALAGKRLKLPIAMIDRVFDDYRFRLGLNRSLYRTMEGQARWAIREGHVSKALLLPNYGNLTNPSFLKKVDPGAVSLQ